MDADVVGIMPKTVLIYFVRIANVRDTSQKSAKRRKVTVTVTPHLQGLIVDTEGSSHIIRDKDKFISFNDNFDPAEHLIELAD